MAELPGDFASGERTAELTSDEELEATLHGDFASGERTEAPNDPGLSGDFASGERTEANRATPGTYADTDS
jgi:hypothetical protein